MITRFAAALCGLACFALPAMAQTADEVAERMTMLFGDAQPFIEAFETIQAAVAEGDGPTLAEYIPYGTPIRVDGAEVVLESEYDLYERYDELITPAIAEAVAAQSFDTLFVNADGVMFGNGEMWLSGICSDESCESFEVKIIALNSP